MILIILSSELNLNFNINASELSEWLKRLIKDAQNNNKIRDKNSATLIFNLAVEMFLSSLSNFILSVFNKDT